LLAALLMALAAAARAHPHHLVVAEAAAEADPQAADAADDEVTTRNASANKLRKQKQKAESDLQSTSPKKRQKAQETLEQLEVEASDKLDRALSSNKPKKLGKVAEREQLLGDIQDTLSAEGTPLKMPRRRWRDPAAVGSEVPIDAGDFAGQYRNGKRLAEGAQGTVDLLVGEGPQQGEVLVLKSTKAQLAAGDPAAAASTRRQQQKLLQRETDIQNLATEGDDVPPHFVRARHVADNQIVMPYGGGSMKNALRSLKANLANGDITDAEYKAVTQEFTKQMLTALRHMDRQGVVHRDLKPDNLTVDPADGNVKIIDFGAAKRRGESDQSIASEGVALGTEGYMAPEQMARRFIKDMTPADLADFNERNPDLAGGSKPKSDVYSVGKMLDRDFGQGDMGAEFDDLKALLTRPQGSRPRAGLALEHPFLSVDTGVPPNRVREIIGGIATQNEDAVARAHRGPVVAPGPRPRPPALAAEAAPGPAGLQPIPVPPAQRPAIVPPQ
jgi:hypothetical protein